ncbi:MAG: TetR/AcrR family transcriptional regulator [Pseudomonadota bacterium]
MISSYFFISEEQNRILDATTEYICKNSLFDFQIEDIAAEAKLPIISVQQSFKCKEDILAALSIRITNRLYTVINTIFKLPLSGPERLISIFLIDLSKVYTMPFSFYLKMLLVDNSIINNITPEWLDKKNQADSILDNLISDTVRNSTDIHFRKKNHENWIDALTTGISCLFERFVQTASQSHIYNKSTSMKSISLALSTDHSLVKFAHQMINAYPWLHPLTTKGITCVSIKIHELGYR